MQLRIPYRLSMHWPPDGTGSVTQQPGPWLVQPPMSILSPSSKRRAKLPQVDPEVLGSSRNTAVPAFPEVSGTFWNPSHRALRQNEVYHLSIAGELSERPAEPSPRSCHSIPPASCLFALALPRCVARPPSLCCFPYYSPLSSPPLQTQAPQST